MPGGHEGGSSRAPGSRLQALLLFGVAVLLYGNTATFRYAHDDALVITGNRFTARGLGGIRDILFHDSFAGYRSERQRYLPGGRYRPLSQVWFAVEHELFGPRPLVGHLTNVLLYGSLAVFLFLTLRRLFQPRDGDERFLSLPFVATALFVMHPLHTEVVANVKGRDEIMGLLGSLAALWFVLDYVERRRVWRLTLAAATFLLALLSKENAVTFMAVIPLTLHLRGGARGRDHLAALAALGAGLTVYLAAFRYPALGYLVGAAAPDRELLNNPFLDATAAQRSATVLLTWLIYLKLLLFPHPLTHDYYPKQIPIVGWGDPRALLSLAIFSGLALFALLRIRRRSVVAYGILFFLLTFSLQSNLVIDVGTFMNERFMFAPSLGYCLIVAWLISSGIPLRLGRGGRTAATALFLAVLSGYAVKTVLRTPAWRDDFTLFTTDADISTNSAKSAVNAGELWMRRALEQSDPAARAALLDKAIAYLRKGVELHPRRGAGWLLLGDAHRHRKDYALSLAAYDRCLREKPGHLAALDSLLVLGQACFEEGQRELAAEVYRTVLRHHPGDRRATTALAGCYEALAREAARSGRADLARQYLRELQALAAR
jgi:tetratricopeptide (TPR) repeat protein